MAAFTGMTYDEQVDRLVLQLNVYAFLQGLVILGPAYGLVICTGTSSEDDVETGVSGLLGTIVVELLQLLAAVFGQLLSIVLDLVPGEKTFFG